MKRNKFLYTVLSVVLGFVAGAIVLAINGTNFVEAYKVIILGSVGDPRSLSWTIINATPIILTGVSVAFAFKTGLFNIGAEGQYIAGTIGAFLVGYLFKLPPIIHPIFALVAGMIFGGLWGALVGLLKSKFKVNEVISSIMLNWIMFYFSNFIVSMDLFRKPSSDNTFNIKSTATIKLLSEWKKSGAGIEFIKNNKFWGGFIKPDINFGIILAIIIAIIAWYILEKTTTGYSLKVVGYSKDAAEYGGINPNRSTIISMAFAGAASGLAGAAMTLGVAGNLGLLAGQQGYGFDGMAVSLIAGNNPLLCIPSGIFFAALNYGGSKLNARMGLPSEIIEIVIGIIVLFIAMPKLFDTVRNMFKKKKVKE